LLIARFYLKGDLFAFNQVEHNPFGLVQTDCCYFVLWMNVYTMQLVFELDGPQQTMRTRIPIVQTFVISACEKMRVGLLVRAQTPQLFEMAIHQALEVVQVKVGLEYAVFRGSDQKHVSG